MSHSYYNKLVLIGDLCADKIMLLHEYTKLPVPYQYKPTVWAHYSSDISIDKQQHIEILSQPVAADGLTEPEIPCNGQRHMQALWNTPDEPDEISELLREHACEQASCIILCFSIQSIGSYGKAQYLYYDEIQRTPAMRKLPLLVVGTHSEFRDKTVNEQKQWIDKIKKHSVDIRGEPLYIIDDMADIGQLVPYTDAKLWAQSVGAYYIETSHATEYNVQHVFHTALKLSINYHNKLHGLAEIPIDLTPPKQQQQTKPTPVLHPASATVLHKNEQLNEYSSMLPKQINNVSHSTLTERSTPQSYNHSTDTSIHKTQKQTYTLFSATQTQPPVKHSLQAPDNVCCSIM